MIRVRREFPIRQDALLSVNSLGTTICDEKCPVWPVEIVVTGVTLK